MCSVRLAYMSELKDRIAEALRRNPHVRPVDLARHCRVSTASVAGWMSGATKTLKAASAKAAAELLGCDQNWLALGVGRPNWRTEGHASEPSSTPDAPSLDAALERLGIALASIPAEIREEVGDALRNWARYGGRDTYRRTVHELLTDAPSSSKRLAHG